MIGDESDRCFVDSRLANWLIQGEGKFSELEYESRDLAHIATKLVAVAKPDAKDNFMNERDANWYLMNSGESLSHLLKSMLNWMLAKRDSEDI